MHFCLLARLCRRSALRKWVFPFAIKRGICEPRHCSAASRTGFDDYDRESNSWKAKIPEKFNFASDVIDTWAAAEKVGKRNGKVPAFWFVFENGKEIKWTFQDLERETKRTAQMLESSCGIRRGDNVMVMLPKMPEFWLVNVAAIRIGFVLSPGSMQLTAKDVAYRLTVFKPSSIVAHESVTNIIDEAAGSCSSLMTKLFVSNEASRSEKTNWLNFNSLLEKADSDHKCADTNSDESMMVFFTSGTTGNPKMVDHSHSSYGIGLGDTGKYWQDLTRENTLWNLSDTGWAKTAYSNLFAPWSCGSCVFVHQMPRFSPTLTLEVLSKYPIDTLCAPPLAYKMMVRQNLEKYNFSKLHHCLSAGEALNPEVIKQWIAATGLKIYEGYGQTETVLVVGMYKCLKYRLGSLGKPAPGTNVVIIDENENELGPGSIGEIAIKRSEHNFGIFKGYKNEPEMTRRKFTEKYFHMGDVGYYDKEGYFWFVGRNDDLINCSGYRIGPFEVESALMEHPAVLEVAVTSSPDPEKGEVVKAFVVLNEEYSQGPESELIKELQDHAKRITAPYKYPRKIEFVTELPKTSSGKIKRFELKQKEWK